MKISEYFDLGVTQPSLDFVDVDVDSDTPVSIDPRAIRIQGGEWSGECVMLLQSFFTEVLEAVAIQDTRRVKQLLNRLGEPNETHLGFSVKKSQGRGLGGGGATDIAESLSNSAAGRSGLLADLEDSALFVKNIGPDIISDITTHIIRGALIGYTQDACEFYGIPMESQASGSVWNPDLLEWQEGYVELPRAADNKLLLVPKSIVRALPLLDKDKYFRGYIAPYLEAEEFAAQSSLVYTLASGEQRVNRQELERKYGKDKLAIVRHTATFPEALRKYKNSITKTTAPPLDHEEIASRTGTTGPDFQDLLDRVLAIRPGAGGATLYHRAVRDLLSAIFYPFLGNVRTEDKLHEGRKRLDIVFDNFAGSGFFYWVTHFKAPTIVVECKNYSRDLNNPELDQIGGRFSLHRGWVGIIVCRKFEDKDLFLRRCRDTAQDNRGYIMALDDDDLGVLTKSVINVQQEPRVKHGKFELLRTRFDSLIA